MSAAGWQAVGLLLAAWSLLAVGLAWVFGRLGRADERLPVEDHARKPADS